MKHLFHDLRHAVRSLRKSPGLVLVSVLSPGLGIGGYWRRRGIGVSQLVTRPLASFLAGLSPMDPLALGGTAAILLLVGFCASYVPARRATKVDPMAALRQQ